MRHKGFTLIEMMIVVAIIAILAAVAYPSYNHHVRKAARKEAAATMLETAGRMERIRTQMFTYQNTLTAPDTRHYDLDIQVQNNGSAFVITATPLGDQLNDECGTITLNQLGEYVYTKNSVTVPLDTCQ